MTSTRSRSDGSFAPVPGGRLWVEDVGRGPAVVFAHGGTGDLRMWDEQVTALADRHRVIRYDQRGFGRSPVATAPFSYVADLGAVLDHAGVDTATLVGTSVGGATVIDYTLAHPDRVTAMVAVAAGISGFPWQISPEQAELESAIAAGDADRVAGVALRLWAPLRTDSAIDERIRRLMVDATPGLMTLGTMWLDHPPAYGRLGDIAVPTLVVVGDTDQSDFHRVADLLADEIPAARKVVLPGVDHNVPVRAARELTALIADFLDEVHPRT